VVLEIVIPEYEKEMLLQLIDLVPHCGHNAVGYHGTVENISSANDGAIVGIGYLNDIIDLLPLQLGKIIQPCRGILSAEM
jgi:GTP cyclohydrolase I